MDIGTKLALFVSRGGEFSARPDEPLLNQFLVTGSVPPRDWVRAAPRKHLTLHCPVTIYEDENVLMDTLSRLVDQLTAGHPAFDDCGFAPPSVAEITGE